MAKIYVELDIQAGLPDILEIDWRNQLIFQRLDYMGIPFHCSLCRRIGHLRRDCHKFPPPVFALDPAEEEYFDGYISPLNQFVEEEATFPRETSSPDDSLVGKIQLLCPSLYNSLSSWDRLFITEHGNNIFSTEALVASPDLPTPSTEPVPSVSLPLPNSSSETFPSPTNPTTRVSSSPSNTTIANSPQPYTLPGYTEPDQSELRLEALFPTALSSHSLPFESLPLPTYQGNSVIHPSPDLPSSSTQIFPTGPDPHWSRGIGLELSPLKTCSARKNSQTELKAPEDSAAVTTHGALRGFKALARGYT
jgi:hypothetical protein